MKKILLILALAFLTKSFAQDPQLFENTWYLQKIILDDGTEHVPIPNDDVPFVALTFYDDTPYNFETSVCNSFGAEVNYQSNNNFLITHSESTLIFCEPVENFYFEGIQFGFFTEGGDHIIDPFSYVISSNGNEKTLIITNTRNDIAIYGDQILSLGQFENVQFSIYPNPVKNIITVQSQHMFLKNTSILVFDINGKLVTSKTIDVDNSNIPVNVSNLNSGTYFLTIQNNDGLKKTIRFIKQ